MHLDFTMNITEMNYQNSFKYCISTSLCSHFLDAKRNTQPNKLATWEMKPPSAGLGRILIPFLSVPCRTHNICILLPTPNDL
jgi:hypothetical protein